MLLFEIRNAYINYDVCRISHTRLYRFARHENIQQAVGDYVGAVTA